VARDPRDVERIAQLESKPDAALKRIEELEEQLRTSSRNSSKPPSSDPPSVTRQPCYGVEPSGVGAVQLRSRQFLAESVVSFMRRGVRSALTHRGARRARRRTVPHHAPFARFVAQRGEFMGDVIASTEVDLVLRLAFDCAVGDPLAVLRDVELDEPLHRRDAVELGDSIASAAAGRRWSRNRSTMPQDRSAWVRGYHG
jgi:hypothetical protein